MTGETYNFITRDRCDTITLYTKIPVTKNDGHGIYYLSQSDCISISDKTKKLFPNIQHGDGIYDITEECFIPRRVRKGDKNK